MRKEISSSEEKKKVETNENQEQKSSQEVSEEKSGVSTDEKPGDEKSRPDPTVEDNTEIQEQAEADPSGDSEKNQSQADDIEELTTVDSKDDPTPDINSRTEQDEPDPSIESPETTSKKVTTAVDDESAVEPAPMVTGKGNEDDAQAINKEETSQEETSVEKEKNHKSPSDAVSSNQSIEKDIDKETSAVTGEVDNKMDEASEQEKEKSISAETSSESAKEDDQQIEEEEPVEAQAQEDSYVTEEQAEVTETKKESDDEDETQDGKEEKVAVNKEDQSQVTKGESAKDQNEEDDNQHKDGHDPHEGKDEADELQQEDYDRYSKEDLVALVEKLSKSKNFGKVDRVLNMIDPLFQSFKDHDRNDALKKYIDDGGTEEDFEYKNELDEHYDACLKLIKDRKQKHFGDMIKQKQSNYEQAIALLEKLRHLVDGEESTTSISAIKEIQSEWKSIGHVPSQHVRTIWASYNALMDRFYDNRSIYFELKELDRKKNLEAKEALCVRAESLENVENLKEAIKELNELHDEFKHIGPVPKTDQDAVWERFKAASDNVYARRKIYYEDLKKDLDENFVKKSALREEVQPFASFDSDRIVEWNNKTQEILDIQKRWESIGGLPKEKASEVNKPFWSAFKQFFNNKNSFFKQLEGMRDENLKMKEELVAKANELKESTDWNQTATTLKKLQNDWRNIGPVPEKKRSEVYKEFKKACDFFFEKRRNRFKEVEKEYEVNLKKKEEICKEILNLADAGETDIEKLEALQESWNSIGFVPKQAIRSSQQNFENAVDKFIQASGMSEDEKNKLKIATKLTSLKGTPNANRKLNKKEFNLRRQISNLENDITLWNNNLEFFANSKNADQVREEFDLKIDKAKKELMALKEQLKIIKEI